MPRPDRTRHHAETTNADWTDPGYDTQFGVAFDSPWDDGATADRAAALTRRGVLLKAALAGGAVLAAAGAVALAGSGPAKAGAPEVYTAPGSDLGAGGYDVVAYFEEGRAVPGLTGIAARYAGARWQFASAAAREAFLAEPERYVPQFGGHCSWAVSRGYTAKGDPEAWRVVDGKLYLNFNTSVRRRWDEDRPGNIARGTANWPGLRGE